jgi:hypothetical protein
MAANNPQVNTTNALEGFAINTKKSFNYVRDVLRVVGNMFLFGKPTPKILDIMTKMYHENVVRNELRINRDDSYFGQKGETLKGSSFKNPEVNFMCGIIEMTNGQLYITISESPLNAQKANAEDPTFHEKEATLREMLKYCNIVVKDPEHEVGNVNAGKVYRKNQGMNVKWRIGHNRVDESKILSEKSCERIEQHLFSKNCHETHNYDDNIFNGEKIEVNLINSFDYLRKRRNEGTSYVPFKKYDSAGKIECNNGSTCTESKLFSYVYNNLDLTFKDIAGIGVFWVGKGLPPMHHLANYCYTPGIEDAQLDKILNETLEIYNSPLRDYLLENYGEETFKKIMKNVVQAFAISCPGCFSNYKNYLSGKAGYKKWEQHDCYVQLTPRGLRQQIRAERAAATASKGGRRSRKTKKNKRVKHRRTTRRV